MEIEKYTLGTGDRFAHQGEAQLQASIDAHAIGIPVFPVWNKSTREHSIIKSHPDELRAEANSAAAALGWEASYYVDADHINLQTVSAFLSGSNFFTLDIAEFIDEAPAEQALEEFLNWVSTYIRCLEEIPGIAEPINFTETIVRAAGRKFLRAVQEAGAIYRYVEAQKGAGNFITEISVDETDTPQTPAELFLILAMIAHEEIPLQTIAPKFTGRFNKGVDYAGDLQKFEQEFDEDLAIVAFAIREFKLPATLKLSVHSGSDKFSLYPIINRLIKKHSAGLHVKTAGTTWLEEVIGLAESGGEGLTIAREIYAGSYSRYDELTAPYSTVIDIAKSRLPSPEIVSQWSSEKYVATLRHDRSNSDYNVNFRQLMHVGFKIAAEMKQRYTDALRANATVIARNVTSNLLDRHIKPIFG